MRVVMTGTGYVGLVSGACFAAMGHDVCCVDTDPVKLELLGQGHVPFFEPGLEELVARMKATGRLSFSGNLRQAVANAEVIFISVGTPPRASDGHADLSAVYSAARAIGQSAVPGTVVATKSTVPLGTGDEIERILQEENDAEIPVVSNPEFLREGSAIADFRKPDRIVIGTADDRAQRIMSSLYLPLAKLGTPIIHTTRRAAELIKYASNAFLAVKITFINEIADLCEAAGTDVGEVALAVGLDARIGSRFLEPGPGFGGSCFPKDTMALTKTAQDFGRPLRLIETTVAINDQRKRGMSRRIIAACGGTVRGRTIAILGLTFKPDTDDMRGAPSLDVIRALQEQGAHIRAYDPAGMVAAMPLLEHVEFAASAYSAAEGTDAIVIVTHWNEFRRLDLERLRQLVHKPVIVDLRNFLNPQEVTAHGFHWHGVGRSSVFPTASIAEIASNSGIAARSDSRRESPSFALPIGSLPSKPTLSANHSETARSTKLAR